MPRIHAAVLTLAVMTLLCCGTESKNDTTSNNTTSNNTTTSNNGASNNTTPIPNAKPEDCQDGEVWAIICECGPANGCSGEVGACVTECVAEGDCPNEQYCTSNGHCQWLCG